MGLYSTNRFRNLTAEYVEENMKLVSEAPDVTDPVEDNKVVAEENTELVSEAPDVTDPKKDNKVVVKEEEINEEQINDDDYIDSLLEALN
jgi:hypothetical protein